MASGKVEKAINYTDYSLPVTTFDPVSYKDFDTGIKPNGRRYWVAVKTLAWMTLSNYWTDSTTGTIKFTIMNPSSTTFTTDSWNAIRIFWL